MRGPVVLSEPRIDTRVAAGVPIPAASTAIHGIADADVADAPRLPELLGPLAEVLADRVVIGQNIRFDLAVLRHEAARAGVAWRDPRVLDVAHLAGALDRSLVDLSLDSLANRFGVTIEARHDALGDSLAAAGIFAALVPRLREADVRTLGEAEALAARRTDLAQREAEAGWHSMPGDAADAPAVPPLARVDSFLYIRRLDEVMSAPARSVRPEGTIREAARIMAERRIGALLVSSGEPRPRGIVTERDLLRAVTDPGVDPDATPVSSVMSAPVQTMSGDQMIYRALGRMDRLRIRHLGVTDASGAAVGMISQRDLLHHRASAAAELGDAVACADDAAALAAAHSRLPDVAAGSGGRGTRRRRRRTHRLQRGSGTHRTRRGNRRRAARARGIRRRAGALVRARARLGRPWGEPALGRPGQCHRARRLGGRRPVVRGVGLAHGGSARRGRGAPMPGRNHGVEPRVARHRGGLARARRRLAAAFDA